MPKKFLFSKEEDQKLGSQDIVEMKKEGVHLLHWKTFLNKLWNDEIILKG